MTWTNDFREMRCRSSIDHLPAPQSAVKKKTVGERSLLRMADARLLLRGYIMVESRLSDRFLKRWLDRLRPKYHCPFRTRSAVHMTDRQQRFVMVGAAVGLVVLIHLAPLWFSER